VQWSDKIGVINISELPDKCGVMVARHDRSDTNKDFYAFYNCNRFNIIKTLYK
jgi:hypothetical protein